MLIIKEATSQEDLDKIYAIRKAVFVEEQSVPLAIEIDEHEKNYIELDGIFDDFPLFIDNDWQYFYFETNLI